MESLVVVESNDFVANLLSMRLNILMIGLLITVQGVILRSEVTYFRVFINLHSHIHCMLQMETLLKLLEKVLFYLKPK
jgi:hypothetical protein